MKRYFSLLLFLYALDFNHQSNADALIVNKAMQASSIAEFYIDKQGVRVELEIGINSLEGFKSLLPDQIYQNMGFGESPLADRLYHFFTEELAIIDKDGVKLRGRLVAIVPSTKVLRDPINGTPLHPGYGRLLFRP